MKQFTTLSFIAAFISMFIIGCGSAPSTPEGVAEEFMMRISKGDKSAIDLMAPEVVAMFGKEKIEQGLADQADKFAKKGGISSIEFTDKKIEENEAKFKTKINFGDGSSDSDKIDLIKKDGKWLVTVSK